MTEEKSKSENIGAGDARGEAPDKRLLIVTGLSGAGISSSLKHLEDMGYEVFDNFPPGLVAPLMKDTPDDQPVAVGIDSRARGFSPEAVFDIVKNRNAGLLFLTADESCLQDRFRETRRTHPMARDRTVADGIQREQELLHKLRRDADNVIDTTDLSIHDLRRVLEGHYQPEKQRKLSVTLMSFGFKYGVPREADIMMDIRFLKNPHWRDDLRPLTGRDKKIGDYIEKDEQYGGFIKDFAGLLAPLFPRYKEEGKNYLTIAIGCTGGRHRSVYTVEKFRNLLPDESLNIQILHRDLER